MRIISAQTEEYADNRSTEVEGDSDTNTRSSSRSRTRRSNRNEVKAASSGGLKIRLSGLSGFGVRKSGRERKQIKDSRYGEFEESAEESEGNARSKRSSKRRRKDSVSHMTFTHV